MITKLLLPLTHHITSLVAINTHTPSLDFNRTHLPILDKTVIVSGQHGGSLQRGFLSWDGGTDRVGICILLFSSCHCQWTSTSASTRVHDPCLTVSVDSRLDTHSQILLEDAARYTKREVLPEELPNQSIHKTSPREAQSHDCRFQ